MTASRSRGPIGAVVGLVAGLVALGPALRPGYLLFYDMVFVPRLALSSRTLGTDGSVPRAVPSDLVVALLSHLAPGWVVQKVLLLAVFVLAGSGAALLCRSRVAAVAAAVAATWNPYVAERLEIGHWAFLLGYAALPWIALAAARVRHREPRSVPVLFATIIATSLTGSTGAVWGVILMFAVLLVPARGVERPHLPVLAGAVAVTVLANATWWYPYLFLAPHGAGDPAGVSAFASAADTPYGTLLSLLTGGGIWNEGVWLADRSSWLLAGVAVVATVGCLALGAWALRAGPNTAARGVALAGAVGLLIAWLSSVPGGREFVTAIVTHVPGGGLLRDSQKFVALPWLAVSLAVGHAAQVVWRLGRRVGAAPALRWVTVTAVAAWPVVTLPGLAWGAHGRWAAVDYPPSMLTAAARLDAAPPGAVAVFPWTLYRRYPWDGDRVLLDPWQRLVSREVIVNDNLPLTGRTVHGESPVARAVTDAIERRADVAAVLRQQGVRWVVVNTDQPGVGQVPALAGAHDVWDGPGVRVLDLGTPPPVTGPVVGGPVRWLGYLGLVVAGVGAAGGSVRRDQRRSLL